MVQDDWPSVLPIPGKEVPRCYKLVSGIVVPSVAVMSKLWLTWFNRTRIDHPEVFVKAIDDHHRIHSYPLVTMCNHHSCLDDPGLWGALFPWSRIWFASRHRWAAAAQDICYTKKLHSLFFSFGRTFPIIRGGGLHQTGVQYALDLMKQNEFLHFFPQGKVVHDHDRVPETGELSLRDCEFDKNYELRWGLARLILEYLDLPIEIPSSPRPPAAITISESPKSGDTSESSRKILLLPFYHIGMKNALPNSAPYIPKIFKRIYISIRESGPILIDNTYLVKHCFNGDPSLPLEEKRRLIMKRLEEELKIMKKKAIQFRDSCEF